jgi:hypothetical protein
VRRLRTTASVSDLPQGDYLNWAGERKGALYLKASRLFPELKKEKLTVQYIIDKTNLLFEEDKNNNLVKNLLYQSMKLYHMVPGLYC